MRKALIGILDYYIPKGTAYLNFGIGKWMLGIRRSYTLGRKNVQGGFEGGDAYLVRVHEDGVDVMQLPAWYNYGVAVPCTCTCRTLSILINDRSGTDGGVNAPPQPSSGTVRMSQGGAYFHSNDALTVTGEFIPPEEWLRRVQATWCYRGPAGWRFYTIDNASGQDVYTAHETAAPQADGYYSQGEIIGIMGDVSPAYLVLYHLVDGRFDTSDSTPQDFWMTGYPGAMDAAMAEYNAVAQQVAAENARRKQNDNNQIKGSGETKVMLSDGTLLASAVYQIDVHNYKKNYAKSTTWDGNPWVDLYTDAGFGNGSGSGSSMTGRLYFTPPEDVCLPSSGTPAPAAITNERARRLKCSDAFLKAFADEAQAFEDGTEVSSAFSQVIKYVRTGHPVSSYTYMNVPLTVTVQIVTTGNYPTNYVDTITVNISYKYIDENGDEQTDSQQIVGTRAVVQTKCTSSVNQWTAYYTTYTYTNWMPLDTNGATTETLDWKFTDDTNKGLFQIQNGVRVAGADDAGDLLSADGTYYSPPVQMTSDNRTTTYADIYLRYRKYAKRKYKVPPPVSRKYVDSVFAHGESVTVIPRSTIHDELGDLGIFPQSADVQQTAKLVMQATHEYTYKYDYPSGTWKFVSAKEYMSEIPDDEGNPEPEPRQWAYDGKNILFRSNYAAWPDTRPTYAKQMDEAPPPQPGLEE